MSADDVVARLDEAIERGEFDDREARQLWLEALDEAIEREREEWYG